MPVLPQIRETTGVSTIQFPSRPASTVFRSISDTAQVFADIQEASDQTGAIKAAGETRAKIKEIRKLNNQRISDPTEYGSTTTEAIDNLERDTFDNASNNRQRQLLERKLSKDFIDARTNIQFDVGVKNKDLALGNFVETEEILSDEAMSDDPAVRSKAYSEYGEVIGVLVGQGFMKEKEGATKILAFNEKTLTKRAKAQINTNPAQYQRDRDKGIYDDLDVDTRAKLSEQAAKKIEQAETKDEKSSKRLGDLVYDRIQSQAAVGNADQETLDIIIGNKHPYLRPKQGIALQKMNDNPPSSRGNDSVAGLRQSYGLGFPDDARINSYRRQANRLAAELGTPNKQLTKFLEKLNADQRSNLALGRAENSAEASQINRDIKRFQDKYKAVAATRSSSTRRKNADKANLALIATMVRAKTDPANIDAFIESRARRKVEDDNSVSQRKKVENFGK